MLTLLSAPGVEVKMAIVVFPFELSLEEFAIPQFKAPGNEPHRSHDRGPIRFCASQCAETVNLEPGSGSNPDLQSLSARFWMCWGETD